MAEMTEQQPVRVVQSGKVYRQMFDAQVELVKTLDNTAEKRKNKSVEINGRNGGKPVVKAPRESVEGTGILTNRQKTWVEEFPNERNTENPVLYRQLKEYDNEDRHESYGTVAGREVRGLPDVVIPAKTGSDIIERIAESRRQRHEAAIEDMRQEMGVISADLAPRITEAGEMLLQKLSDSNNEIDELMSRIEKDESLLSYSLYELHELWNEIQAQSTDRRNWIQELDQALSQVEVDRMDMIRSVFQEYAKTLEKIAHFMKPDLLRLLDSESQMINQTVLSNKRAYADLYTRLMSADIEREKKHHTQLIKRVEDWKGLNTQRTIESFHKFMESERIVSPSGVEKVLQYMVAEQQQINNKRLDLISSLKDMKPPGSTKTSVYQWNQQIFSLSEHLDMINQKYLQMLYEEYELACSSCLEEMDRVKAHLIDAGICTDQKAQEIITEHLLPVIGERQRLYENEMEKMDKQIEQHTHYVNKQLKNLFKYCQGAAHTWDVHEIGLAKQERALQEKLEMCRHHHDNINQEKEANLDITMDRMRQDGNETALKENLNKALNMLQTIKKGYEEFHTEQFTIINHYPEMIMEELDGYDGILCKYFGIDRRHPDEIHRECMEEYEKQVAPPEDLTPRTSRGSKISTKLPKKKYGDNQSSVSQIDRLKTPVPMSIIDSLSTNRGTHFYVLSEAGEYGVPPDGAVEHDPPPENEPVTVTFMTETEHGNNQELEYIKAANVADDLLLEIKKIIRINFLDHLEEWVDQAVERANNVIAAKTEELNSELDLRLHLHGPRARRAELDVHNVRAAELVMHSERVSRHCKGVLQTLTDLKHQFTDMTTSHNKLFDKYRAGIENLETVFVNATKSSKLVALQNQLQVELDKFMNQIRASLRQFRQHLDDTLQMLRESNARFIKSFKLFSDGGNFCPEEIEDYRKRLDKMSHKIDSSEGFVMADLEGMESKRLDQATKVSNEFEDRFKNHMIDLIFMEKIARWLTNTQVKIKAEVADSNSQAQRLAQHLIDLDRRIDACEKPNLDKEQISPGQLNDSLNAIFEAFHDRSVYLHCVKEVQPRASTPQLQGNPAIGARVGFAPDLPVPTVSKPGKQPIEDPSVGVIKNILKTQKTKSRFGPDADLDGDNVPGPTNATTTTERDKMKSGMSRSSTKGDGDKSKQGSRKGTASAAASDAPKRTGSAQSQRLSPVPPTLSSNSNTTNTTTRRVVKGKFDIKFLVFGEKEEMGEDAHFLGKITRILRGTLLGLLTSADVYYRQKGNRAVTRPQALQETFEQCAEIVVDKLQSYYKQADEYHNQCLQEFRRQLWKLEHLIARVPPLIINEIRKNEIASSRANKGNIEKEFEQNTTKLDDKKHEHKNLLRPTLGHPHHIKLLAELCELETARKDEFMVGLDEHINKLQKSTVTCAGSFVEKIARASEQLLIQFDILLTVDDVERGRVPPTKYPTSELLRRTNAGLPLEDDENKNALPRGKNTWQGIVRNELVAGDKPKKILMSASVSTAKTTLGHSSTVTARNQAYEDYKNQFENTLQQIEQQKESHLISEQRWTDSWLESVHKVKLLYQA